MLAFPAMAASRTILVLVALFFYMGCGESNMAREPDATAPAPIEEVVVILGESFQGTTVFSSEATGELIDSDIVAGNGKAVISARPGGTVSFLRYGFELITFAEILTEEDLIWREEEWVPGVSRTLTVEFDAVGGGNSVRAYGLRGFRF